jgi:outer membrane protein assembly factor BamB
VQALARVALGIVVFVFVAAPLVFGRGGDVSNSDVLFVETTESTPAAVAARAGTSRHPADDHFEWPVYGFTKARTHHLPLNLTPRPPYHQAWAYRGKVLLEFSPVLCGRKIYVLKNNAALYALSRRTGKPRWKRRLGHLAAASPACSHGVIYVVVLERTRGSKGGRVVAVAARNGRTLWSRKLPSRAESSPLIDRGTLIFGTEDGRVYALRAKDGRIRWTYRAGGAVKGAIALDAGKLYFGDYAGKVYAIRRSNGHKVWVVKPIRRLLGIGEGNFYSSPAVAYGRVYIGSTNGDVFSLSATDGKLGWRKRTGNYVYASPAVGRVGKGPPTVYVGSYDGHFYALDARSGRPRWVRWIGKKISGAATIVGDLVFVSDLAKKTTWALGTGTGQTVWKTRRGGFNPVISDGRRIYFAGFTSLFALDHAGRPFDGRARPQPTPQQRSAREQAVRRARLRAAGARRALHERDVRAARRVRSARRARHERDLRAARKVRSARRARHERDVRAARKVRSARRARHERDLRAARKVRSARRARHERDVRAARRARAAARARARQQRHLQLRFGLHGHHHSSAKANAGKHCHRHRHVYTVRGKTIVLVHSHCHRHTPR